MAENKTTLLEEAEDHQTKSKSYLDTFRTAWLDYESIVIASHREAMQNKNKVYDPRLGTIELERTARVMAQRPSGKAKPVSDDDMGKAQLMNHLLGYQTGNADEQFSMLIKLRMLSFWSRVYGAMFALTPWRIKDDYIGPELNVLSIWDSFPQPNVQVSDAEWFVQQAWVSIKWLLQQDSEVWDMEEIKNLANEMKRDGDEGDIKQQGDETGEIEQELYPSQFGDKAFPKAKVFTEFRKDKWITWTPKRVNSKVSRPRILRVVARNDKRLPVVGKQFIPTLVGPIGIGPFQRGKSLQFATNQLINLHLSGVKSSVFPEIMVNPKTTVISTLKYGSAEKWFMNNPGTDVMPVAKSAEAINVFNSTYGMLIGAMLNQGGTSDTTSSTYTESSLGKTPQALRIQAAAQAALDEWEEVMLHDSIKQIMIRWMEMNVNELETAMKVRLFGTEIEELVAKYPDTQALVQGNSLVIDKTAFLTPPNEKGESEPIQYDYDMEIGATSKPNLAQEKADVSEFIEFITKNPQVIEMMAAEGKKVSISELIERAMKATGIKDIDKIITDAEPPVAPGVVPGAAQAPQQPVPQFDDQDINQVADELLGGTQGIPAV